jgi:predicted nuclease of predicted toxin-antitoxin system
MATAIAWLADENVPLPAFRVIENAGWDIKHIGIGNGGIPDTEVMQMAIEENRFLITFDGDHGTLVFKDGYRPLEIVYFRLDGYMPDYQGHLLIKLAAENFQFYRYITVIEDTVIRQRPIPS